MYKGHNFLEGKFCESWMQQIARKEDIEDLADRLSEFASR
jgi:hypothetical protein